MEEKRKLLAARLNELNNMAEFIKKRQAAIRNQIQEIDDHDFNNGQPNGATSN